MDFCVGSNRLAFTVRAMTSVLNFKLVASSTLLLNLWLILQLLLYFNFLTDGTDLGTQAKCTTVL